MSSSSQQNIVETELLRKRIYESEFINWAVKELPELKYKEVCHLLLRYLFNKNISKTESDDPVFILTRSPLAEEQLVKDFVYNKSTRDPQKFIAKLEEKFSIAYKMMEEVVRPDRRTSLYNNKIMYGTWTYEDIAGLAKKNPSAIKYALTLNIRYNYLKLTNHGLARIYKDMAKPDEGCEAFASAFNHYFDSFCSAFPDLEKPFGSMGSFFNMKEWPCSKIYMNPPFDESLMAHSMEKVMKSCKESRNEIEFMCTFPDWGEFPKLEQFKVCEMTRKVNIYKKGEIPFVDYMNNGRIIYPCGIVEVIIGRKE